MRKIHVEILGLSASPSAGGAYALLLKEVYGSRRLPIIIGSFEAQSIALEMEGIKPPRPLTHDLLATVIENLGGTVVEIVIDELRDNTFFAKIKLELSTMTNEIDARPSDAIALAIRTGANIFISEEVMRTASFIPSSEDSEEKLSHLAEEEHDDEESDRITKGDLQETKIASLQNQLREAIEKEDYERAAKLRDEINKITGTNN